MDEIRRTPAALKAVAGFYIAVGIYGIIHVFVSPARDKTGFDFKLVWLFIGLGMLSHRSGWRICGLVLVWATMLGAPIIVISVMGGSGPLAFLSYECGKVSRWVFLVLEVTSFAFTAWQYHILRRADVVRLFRGRSTHRRSGQTRIGAGCAH